MNNDTVNRIDVLRELAPFRGYIPDKYLDKLIAIMSELPPAEQPKSAVEYERLSRLFFCWCSRRLCSECDFFADCPKTYKPWPRAMPTPEERVELIMKWAQGHPEEVVE